MNIFVRKFEIIVTFYFAVEKSKKQKTHCCDTFKKTSLSNWEPPPSEIEVCLSPEKLVRAKEHIARGTKYGPTSQHFYDFEFENFEQVSISSSCKIKKYQ